MHKRPRPTWNASRIALLVGLAAALVAGPALAADTGNGSKNFRVPNSVPNYFSNEAGPMMGPAAETRRGEIYANQTAQVPQAAPAVAAAPPRARQHVAMAEPRGQAIRGRRGASVVAHHVAVHGRSVTRVVAHGSSRAHSTHVAAKTRAVSKTTRVSSSHRRARG
jgi:hypothetical protein